MIIYWPVSIIINYTIIRNVITLHKPSFTNSAQQYEYTINKKKTNTTQRFERCVVIKCGSGKVEVPTKKAKAKSFRHFKGQRLTNPHC